MSHMTDEEFEAWAREHCEECGERIEDCDELRRVNYERREGKTKR